MHAYNTNECGYSSSASAQEGVARAFIMDYSLYKIAKYIRLLGYDTICTPHVSHEHIVQIAATQHRTLVTSSRGLLRRVADHNAAAERRRRVATREQQQQQQQSQQRQQQPTTRRRVVVGYDSDGASVYSDASSDEDAALTTVTCLHVRQWRASEFQATMIDLVQRTGLVFDAHRVFSRCVLCNDELRAVAKSRVRGRVEARVYAAYTAFTECPSCGKVFWGYDKGRVSNYKTYRTVDALRALCAAAHTPMQLRGLVSIRSLRSLCAFPRRVKQRVLMYLDDDDAVRMATALPYMTELVRLEQLRRRNGRASDSDDDDSMYAADDDDADEVDGGDDDVDKDKAASTR